MEDIFVKQKIHFVTNAGFQQSANSMRKAGEMIKE